MKTRFGQVGIVAVAALAIGLSGCSRAGGDTSPKLEAQAQADLARWADAVAASGNSTFAPVGDLTGQAGDWELAVGGNDKLALMAGLVEWTKNLPGETPPDGQILWQDGSMESVGLISAQQAISNVKSDAKGSCQECTPLQIVGAQLTTGTYETNRGSVKAPMWEFTVQGTAVRVTRLAVDDRVEVIPPSPDPDAPFAIAIDSATVSASGDKLTVSFTGAPGPASESCGADYTAESVESLTAVVVIVTEHAHSGLFEACSAVGAIRTAVAQLASPLACRAVLNVSTGQPVAVTPDK